ncbi:hypothetical protein Cch01nite_26570 [Cellulomonas chitinilytica]|uniref:Alpha/beta hydrolase n=1 Tax=Cellulomonas chitinilytica TaxID=398759 RepID=A0A919P295_9CELL|nr:hypothetical protein [Cellulomonas chitinilytica]GIG21933.1 hypothetical protein Cch01nite_26570 [Cellulomonas chitinilytica]
MTPAPDWGTGYDVVGGRGPTRADLDELARAARALETAARRLDDASSTLDVARQVAVGHLIQHHAEASAAVDALTATRTGTASPARTADHLRDLAGRLRHVVQDYDDAESWVHRLVRSALEADAVVTGSAGILGAAGAAAQVVGGALLLADGASLHAVLVALRDRDPDALLRVLREDLAPGRLVADGRAELALDVLARYLVAVGGHLGLPPRDAVPFVARAIASLLPDAGPTVVLTRDDPPQLAAPRDAADLLRRVGSTYRAPYGVITVQRLDHPDGSRSWAVEIPGTESSHFNADAPTDMTTNLRLEAGLPDDMSTAVIEAMRRAGIPPDEPVAIAGHSQGGMVAQKVAALAVGLFDVRAIVAAGSPDIPVTVPTGVAVLHVRHDEDAVPQTDGKPDDGSDDVVVLGRNLPVTAGGVEPDPVAAHSLVTYVESVKGGYEAMGGNPGLRAFHDVLTDVLGPDGTTATTFQFQATRDPDLVRHDPATGLPRPPTIRPVLEPVSP